MGADFSKTSNILFFGAVLPAISIYASWEFFNYFNSLPFWVETVTPLFAYATVFSFFEEYLWHWPVFRWLGIVNFPDIRGRWSGMQHSHHRQEDIHRDSRVVFEFVQNFSRVYVRTYYLDSQSESIASNFALINGEMTLYYIYDSEPNSFNEAKVEPHRGSARLKHLHEERKLIGSYFNSLGNYGEIELTREGHKLHSRFTK
jgi:SMODS-associating 2TM, beta-strand rich effector domain